jgi:hypothetical protein
MCCKDKQGNESVTVIQGACQSGARETCGCEEKQGHNAVPMPHGVHHSHPHGMCGCHKSRPLSKEEQIELLEGYRESLKRELEGVEEELKEIKG